MQRILTKIPALILAGMIFASSGFAQPVSVDRIIAVVGDNIVMQSDLEGQYAQMVQQGYDMGSNGKCAVLEELLFQKLLLNQAKLDSVDVSDDQVEIELERRIRYFSAQAGGEDKLKNITTNPLRK